MIMRFGISLYNKHTICIAFTAEHIELLGQKPKKKKQYKQKLEKEQGALR